MEAAGHLPLLLRDGRGVLPLRRADLRHEVRQLDLRRLPGKFIFDLGAIISKHLESLDPFLHLPWMVKLWEHFLTFYPRIIPLCIIPVEIDSLFVHYSVGIFIHCIVYVLRIVMVCIKY